MSDDSSTGTRPHQLTVAGWGVVGGSALLLVSVFDAFSQLNSLTLRNRLQELLATGDGGEVGLSVARAQELMRSGLMVLAVALAVTTVLGVYALRRSKPSRLVLSILAPVVLVLGTLLTGSLLGLLVSAATAALWTGPARDWFDGRPVRRRPAPDRGSGGVLGPPGPGAAPYSSTPPVRTPSSRTAPVQPPATDGYGRQRVSAPGWATPPAPTAADGPFRTPPVPGTVRAACWATWVFAGLLAVLGLLGLLVLAVARDQVIDQVLANPRVRETGLPRRDVVAVAVVSVLLYVAWSGAAMVLAWFVWRRHNWARILLALSAGLALLAGLAAFPFLLAHQVAAVMTIAWLFGPPARAWFADQRSPAGPPQGPPAGPPAGSPGGPVHGPPTGPRYGGSAPDQPPRDEPPVW